MSATVFPEDGVSPGVQQAFASILGESAEPPSSEEEEDSLSYVDDEDDKDFVVEDKGSDAKTGKGRKKHQRGEGCGRRTQKPKEEAEEEAEDVTVGDVFALEMELSRENKKHMKVCPSHNNTRMLSLAQLCA